MNLVSTLKRKIIYYLTSLGCRLVHIQSSGVVYEISYQANQFVIQPAKSNNALILLADKDAVFETHQVLPVNSDNEAKQILKHLTHQAPFDGVMSKCVNQTSNEYVANLSSTVLPEDAQYRFVLPLHWVLLRSVDKAQYQFNLTSYIASVTFGVFTAIPYQQSSPVMNEPSLSDAVEDIPVYSQQSLLKVVFKALVKVPLHWWLNALCVNRYSGTLTEIPWRKFSITASIVLGAYAVISSISLYAANQIFSHQADIVVEDATSVAKQRREYFELTDRLSLEASLHNQNQYYLDIWHIVTELLGQGVNITALNVNDDKIQMFGNAESASDVILSLEAQGLQNVSFISSVRENRRLNRQNFSIEFERNVEVTAEVDDET